MAGKEERRLPWARIAVIGVILTGTAAAYLIGRARSPLLVAGGGAADDNEGRAPFRGHAWTADRRHQVTVEPAVQPVPMGTTHAWTVTVQHPDGGAATGCSVVFDGTMPEHGHGLPTKPRVTAEPQPGRYRVEGVRFSMPGHWRLDVETQGGGCSPGTTAFDLQL